MASQEFLASFAVDIDEAGVSRLQAVLEENRDLANEVAAAFEAATTAIMEYEAAATGIGTGSREENRDSGNAAKEPVSWKDIGLSSNPTEMAGDTELITAVRDLLREPMEQAREYMKQAMEAEETGRDGSEYVQTVDEVLRKPLEQVREMFGHFGDVPGTDEPKGEGAGEPKGKGTGEPKEKEAESRTSLELDITAADEALEAFREKASEPISVSLDASDSLGEGNDQSGKLNMDLTEARASLESFREDASKPVPLSGNASGMVSAARSAYLSIRSMFSTPITITARVEKEGTGDGAGNPAGGPVYQMSSGGRFTKPTDVQVAEDGDAEYIIPVKKEDRALPLLKQLLSELSPAARASLSLGDAAQPLAGGLSAGTATSTQITQNNSNVSAPVNIQVHASRANAEQVGQKLYDTAERYLLRTLQGSMA